MRGLPALCTGFFAASLIGEDINRAGLASEGMLRGSPLEIETLVPLGTARKNRSFGNSQKSVASTHRKERVPLGSAAGGRIGR